MAPPSIVLVVFDAMRKDVLSVYGGRSPTPNLDAFASEATVYPNCIAPSPWTIPSHASLFTGKFPSEHGVHESYEEGLSDTLGLMKDVGGLTLSESLKNNGYQTIGLPANGMLSLRPGFDRGFDWFQAYQRWLVTLQEQSVVREAFEQGRGKAGTALHLLSRGKFVELWRLYSILRKMKKARKITGYPKSKGGNFIVETLAGLKLSPPFFVFVNFMETHEPYTAFEQQHVNIGPFNTVGSADLYEYKEIPAQVMGELRSAYSEAVSKADEYFGRLVAFLKMRGIYEDSLIVITSDHGQEFKEHGFYTHGNFLHDEIVDAPLIVRYPRGRRSVVESGYQNLCDVHSLIVRTSAGEEASMRTSETTFSESFGVVHKPPTVADPGLKAKLDEVRAKLDRPRKAVYRGGYKLVLDWNTKGIEEFTMHGQNVDPSEQRNLADSLIEELLVFERGAVKAAPRAAQLSPEEEATVTARLRDLGYLG